MKITVNGYELDGEYTACRSNRSHVKGEPSDTPPEPAQFSIYEVYDADGDDIYDILSDAELAALEREAIKQIREGY